MEASYDEGYSNTNTSETRYPTSVSERDGHGTPGSWSVEEEAGEWLRFLNKRWSCGKGGERGEGKDVIEWHRIVCIDWLAEVRTARMLKNRTLVRAATLFNTVITELSIAKSELQTYAITSLVMAAKIEEPCAVDVQKYADLTCGVCNETKLKQTEMQILIALNFQVNFPTISDFLYPLLSHLAIPDVKTAEFISEATLYNPTCTSSLPPQTIAAGVVSVVTGGGMDDQISSSVATLFQIGSWEEARVPVTAAVEECFTFDFKRVVGGNTTEVAHATKAHFFPTRKRKFCEESCSSDHEESHMTVKSQPSQQTTDSECEEHSTEEPDTAEDLYALYDRRGNKVGRRK